MSDVQDLLQREPEKNCPACAAQRLHSVAELREFHPLSGHGFSDGKWSDPRAKAAHDQEVAELEKRKKK